MGDYFWPLVLLEVELATAGPARAQLDNRAFTSPVPGTVGRSPTFQGTSLAGPRGPVPSDSLAGQLRLSVHAFAFFKDNEYFNKIVDGYTLFGTQLFPQLIY